MTQTQAPPTFPCPNCGNPLSDGQLVCPRCNVLVYSQRLQQIAGEAIGQERVGNPVQAAAIWGQALALLPPDSIQYRDVSQRIAALTSSTPGVPVLGYQPRPEVTNDSLPVALLKTVGSMIVSIVVYTWLFSGNGLAFGAKFATGFVILMLIHELGHVIAMRYFKLSASPPIFIPFLGALINLREPPRNALEEAIVGIGGPVTGTIAAGITYLLYLHAPSRLMLELAEFGFFLNLMNMLPVPPLDGGRITAAVSPWIWLMGLVVAVAWVILDWVQYHQLNYIIVLLLFIAWPRVKRTLLLRARGGPYYQIGAAARWSMGIAYAALGLFLVVMYVLCGVQIAFT